MEKPNTKCIKCGKIYYSQEGGFHKEDSDKYYETYCSKECAKAGGLTGDELEDT